MAIGMQRVAGVLSVVASRLVAARRPGARMGTARSDRALPDGERPDRSSGSIGSIGPAQGVVGVELARYLAGPGGHLKVEPEAHRNRSVAFVVAALRRLGVAVPERGSAGGADIARTTLGLSRYLGRQIGWTSIGDARALVPGDLVFTADATCCPGYPAQCYVFLGWRRRSGLIALVADGRRAPYDRPLFPAARARRPGLRRAAPRRRWTWRRGDRSGCGAGSPTAPFSYALRAPV